MENLDYFNHVDEAVGSLKQRGVGTPDLFVVLSGGMGLFADELEDKIICSSVNIPHFPKATAEGHSGQLIYGCWKGKMVLALKGRFHYYEGHSMQEVTFPTHVAHGLGADLMLVTNAAGGVNPAFTAGDIMLIDDHINFMGAHPLRGIAMLRKENQFTDMTNAYDRGLRDKIIKLAVKEKVMIRQGTYLAVSGPSYETPAEIKAFRAIGADAVGMSTIPEVIVANFYKMNVMGLSVIANMAADLHGGNMSHAEVLESMREAQPKMIQLIKKITEELVEIK